MVRGLSTRFMAFISYFLRLIRINIDKNSRNLVKVLKKLLLIYKKMVILYRKRIFTYKNLYINLQKYDINIGFLISGQIYMRNVIVFCFLYVIH